MTEILEVGILGCKFSFFTLPALLVHLVHPVVELVSRVVGETFGLLFLRNLGSVDLCRKVWLKSSSRLRLAVALRPDNDARQNKNHCKYPPFHRDKDTKMYRVQGTGCREV